MIHNAHGASTRSKQHVKFGGDPFPQKFYAASGCRIWCSDGDERTDWIAGLGSISLSYRDSRIDGAVGTLLHEGVTSGPLPSVYEERIAAQLCEFLGWPEQVRWVNSGSEATAGAMLIARRATGRRLIYSVGYHGWHETHLAGHGLYIYEADETPFYRNKQVAAAILDCGRDEHPSAKWLMAWREWCNNNGALLIADEVWAGLRLARGGWSERYGVRPDLACFSKALGNGVPVAAIVGSEALMQHASDVSSTFGGNGLGLAAASAVMHVYEKEPVLERLNAIGEHLLRGCPTILCGVPAKPHFCDAEHAVAIVQHCAARGHLVHPTGVCPMYAHSDADIESLIAALNEFTL